MLDRPVSYYMSTPVFSIAADVELVTAQQRLEQHRVSALLVQDGADPIAAVLSRADLLRVGRVDLDPQRGGLRLLVPSQLVRDAATPSVVTVSPEGTSVREAARAMLAHGVHRVFVATPQHAYGVLSTRDVMRALVDARASTSMAELMTSPVRTIAATVTIEQAVSALRDAQVVGIVVTDAAGWPVGMFTQEQAVESAGYFSIDPVERAMSHRFIVANAPGAAHHVAARAIATRARHAIVMEQRSIVGIVSGLDFARAAVEWSP